MQCLKIKLKLKLQEFRFNEKQWELMKHEQYFYDSMILIKKKKNLNK